MNSERHVQVFAPSIFWEIILEDSYLSSSLERLLATVCILCKNTVFCLLLLYTYFSLLSYQTKWNLYHSHQRVNKILVWTLYTIWNKTTDWKKEKLKLIIVASIRIEIKMWQFNIKDGRTVFVWHNFIMIGGHFLKVKMYPPQFFSLEIYSVGLQPFCLVLYYHLSYTVCTSRQIASHWARKRKHKAYIYETKGSAISTILGVPWLQPMFRTCSIFVLFCWGFLFVCFTFLN